MIVNCLITGVGGQGTVFMARIIASAAVNRGFEVLGAETIGMAQRGGSVVSHIRIGTPHSPLIPLKQAGVIIAFEPAEAVRSLPFLAPTGKLLALDRGVPPVTSSLGRPTGDATGNANANGAATGSAAYDPDSMTAFLRQTLGDRAILVSGDDLIRRLGNAKALNMALLGAALARGMLPFTPEEIAAVIRERLPPKPAEMNLAALEIGSGI
jgi:indolepyruvate ferredoxin oxidoreductase beta subunit